VATLSFDRGGWGYCGYYNVVYLEPEKKNIYIYMYIYIYIFIGDV